MTLWSNRWWVIYLDWELWTFGLALPRAGMVVWSFYLGPLHADYWPQAPDIPHEPF